MPRHTTDDLLRALSRSELSPVYYLCGTEVVLREEALQTILDLAIPAADRSLGLEQRSAAGLDPDDLHSALNAMPMFGARRVLVLRDTEAWKRKTTPRPVLLKYLENPASETVVILVENAPSEDKLKEWEPDGELVARTYAVNFEPLPPERVVRWVTYRAEGLKVRLEPGAAEHLAAACNNDLGALRSELEKLASLPETAEPLTAERVGELVGVRHGETALDWRDAVLSDDAPRAIRVLQPVLNQSGMSGVKLVTLLGASLLGLSIARSHYDRKLRGNALERVVFGAIKQLRLFGLGKWTEEARNWSRWAEAWPADRLNAAIAAALAADRALKDSRVSDEGGVLTGLVLQLSGGKAGRLVKGTRGSTRNEPAGV
ncbi:MAG TPA: DNA polymerase III subunit delta [Gemmatimonadales bacterium]|nr:DNA polymerase III subunit delta [Gemmatimonadales bacterium]